MIKRHVTQQVQDALTDTPVILINGARQTGKSTLAQWISKEVHPATYVTLDDAGALSSALASPKDFIARLNGPVIIDEIQRAPELFLAIKAEVDRDRRPGRFLLTGSADVLLLPRLADSLAGRMEIITLWPLSQGELAGKREQLIDNLFDPDWRPAVGSPLDSKALWSRILSGGYPESVERKNQARRNAWFGSYVTTILQRDIRDLSNIDGLTTFPRLLRMLAARTTTLLNIAELGRSVGLAHSTLKRYMSLLEMTFLVQQIPAWSSNLGKRLTKSPKIILNDTGLVAYLQDVNQQRLTRNPDFSGKLMENFIIMEMIKQITWSEKNPSIYHYRTQNGQEIDILLEDAAGSVVGIEIKASSTVKSGDFRALRSLSESLGDRFVRGIVFYTGEHVLGFGENLTALPVQSVWN